MIPETDKPGVFTFIIVLAGATIGGAVGTKIHERPQLDELDTEIFNKSIIHGFVVTFTLIGYQALTHSFLNPAEEVLAASGTVLLSMMLQFAIKNYNVGDYLP
jgi:putative Mn2+ efflux pump MntP